MKHLLQRLLESAAIAVLSSFPISLIILMGLVSPNNLTYFIVFGLGAAIFYVLNVGVLRRSLIRTESNRKYFLINGAAYLFIAAVSFVMRQYTSANLYTAFFGFTKFLDRIEGFSFAASWLIFWGIYLLEIIYFPVERIFVMKRADKMEFEE